MLVEAATPHNAWLSNSDCIGCRSDSPSPDGFDADRLWSTMQLGSSMEAHRALLPRCSPTTVMLVVHLDDTGSPMPCWPSPDKDAGRSRPACWLSILRPPLPDGFDADVCGPQCSWALVWKLTAQLLPRCSPTTVMLGRPSRRYWSPMPCWPSPTRIAGRSRPA
ncbi:hypothetical protein Pcac1_g24546 [Phytophthora cactorum]|nr:hypothetical protein Pcac1_g24546 [Phytophthora cactorum]